MNNILDIIIKRKLVEVADSKKRRSTQELKSLAKKETKQSQFFDHLVNRQKKGLPALIAECKKGSPSRDVIVKNYDPIDIAIQYQAHGASAISVLTDNKFFFGEKEHIEQVKQIVSLPILRKDFIVDSYQIPETKLLGADCILLIAACLSKKNLKDFLSESQDYGLDVLIEVHTEKELEYVLTLGHNLIGINNRNLKEFKTDIENSVRLKNLIPESVLVVSESGLKQRSHIEKLEKVGINAYLVGETFLETQNIGEKIRELFPQLVLKSSC